MADWAKVRQLYGRLVGIKDFLAPKEAYANISLRIIEDYNNTLDALSSEMDADFSSYKLTGPIIIGQGRDSYTYVEYVREKLLQIISVLEIGYSLGAQVVELGTLYNAIKDEELKSRCSDILSAPGHFDRVINQATQILEDRIRKKAARHAGALTGVQLVNVVMKGDPAISPVIISDVSEEQEGITHICRGIMLAFRNPTHHYITDSFTREDALKVVSFIDKLLQLITNSRVIP